jgi:superfamily II DNA/RNA helicase
VVNPIHSIRDNRNRGTVADFLREKLEEGSLLSVVSAYFTIYAYDALKTELERVERLDFLFGEPSFINRLDPAKTETKAFVIDAGGLELSNKLQQRRVAKECAAWIKRKVEIKTIKQSNLLHGKMYHVANKSNKAAAILGSSNFTTRGLGLASAGNNIELNLVVDSDRDREEIKHWFDEAWNSDTLVKDVKEEVLAYLEQLYQNNTPAFIYYKTLYHVFEKYLLDTSRNEADLDRTSLFDTQIWKALFEFQKDGVKGVINKILKHNGCILADSVGLGKTYEALAVIKYFELKNERVLVLCPKKLRGNWTVYKSNDALNPLEGDRFRYDVLNHTDLSRDSGDSGDIKLATLNWGNYDLVVIDESHNFRNNSVGQRDADGNIIRKSRYKRLMDDIIKSGVRTKVLLLSATPVNNGLSDLGSQLSFIAEGRDDAFLESTGIASVRDTLSVAQRVFTNWAQVPADKRTTGKLLEQLSANFLTLLDEVTIARSRKHILKYYADSVAKLGGFPKRELPITLTPDIDLSGRFPSYDKINDEISDYKLALFNPSKFVLPEYHSLYETNGADPFKQGDRETYLIGMMKMNFLKRLESSIKSFEITMERTIEKIETLEEKIRQHQLLPSTAAEPLEIELDAQENVEGEDPEEESMVGGKLRFRLDHLRLDGEDGWLAALKRDKDQVCGLYNAARAVTPKTDAKLAELKALIRMKVSSPTIDRLGNQNRKVLVFTAFADTANYLYHSLQDWVRDELGIHMALVCGDTTRTTLGGSKYDQILTNFAPRAKGRAKVANQPQNEEIDLLIATDCISEGQNLQDCDYLINYDIHWNPVRIIQRFGRIDRIGSVNKSVQLVNFWPTADLNKYLNLKGRVEARMALVDLSATLEDNILNTKEVISADLQYRDRQLLRLKDEVLDLEDLSSGASLTEFSLDDFRFDLLKHIEANKSELEAAPLGLYACVPTNAEHKTIGPGVVFCFRSETVVDAKKVERKNIRSAVNPLNPYFLVYVLDDGNVRYGFAHARQILDIYRLLCAGDDKVHEDLSAIFDQETNHGSDMKRYEGLVSKGIASISATYQSRVVAGLQNARDFVLPGVAEQPQSADDFELVTWLIVKDPA